MNDTIQKDKAIHMLACVGIAGILYTVGYGIGGYVPALIFSVFGTITIGIIKELYDAFKPNPTGFSWSDIAFDVTGMVFGIAMAAVII